MSLTFEAQRLQAEQGAQERLRRLPARLPAPHRREVAPDAVRGGAATGDQRLEWRSLGRGRPAAPHGILQLWCEGSPRGGLLHCAAPHEAGAPGTAALVAACGSTSTYYNHLYMI